MSPEWDTAPRAHDMSQPAGPVIERVCVIGGGVIGSLFAGHLAQVAEVSVLTRRQEHADALNANGLRVSGRSEVRASVTASCDPARIPPFDLGIVATKATGLEAAATTLEGHFPEATIMTTLNGLGAEEAVRRHGAWPIISAVTFMSGTRHDDTHVEYILDTETWLGPYEDTPYESVEEAAALIRAAGLKVEALPDLRPGTDATDLRSDPRPGGAGSEARRGQAARSPGAEPQGHLPGPFPAPEKTRIRDGPG